MRKRFKNFSKNAKIIITVTALVIIIVAINAVINKPKADYGDENSAVSLSQKNLPAYKVYSVDDSSFGNVIRKSLNIVVNTDDYTDDDLYRIAVKEIEAYTKNIKVNACTAGFYTSTDHIKKGYDMGRVEYVPNGELGNAVNVKCGDYSSFQFVNYLQ